MRLKHIIPAVCIAFSLGSVFGADSKLGSALKSTGTAVSGAVDAGKKKAQDSANAVAAAVAKRAEDSVKAVAAAAEAKAKHFADSVRAALAAKPVAKDTAKPAATVITPEPAKTEPVAVAKPAQAGCSVAKIAFGTAVENKELTGEAAELPAGRVHCWTRLACGSGAIKLSHVWYKDGVKTQTVSLSCQSGSGRVWSNAPVTAGKWKVEVVKESGESMGSGEFTVK